MPEMSTTQSAPMIRVRHRQRMDQVGIYLGKMLRMFIYQNDWKMLPMAAVIAGMVGMVIRRRFFISMEGTLMGSFAMVCVAIWNGCFNSIQVICRERDVIKREHRSGMHISSYIASHMIYQAMLCLAQTLITIYVIRAVGVKYPAEGVMTGSFLVDFCISMFLISYASDMLSLWVSTLAHTTTAAMTIMPFVLIFQLVFSGGMMNLPAWTEPLTQFTISNPGLNVICAQADRNNRPFTTISDMVGRLRDNEVGGSFTVAQIVELLEDKENPTIAELREKTVTEGVTVGDLIEQLAQSDLVKENAGEAFEVKIQLGKLYDVIGEEKIKTFLEQKAAESSYDSDYENDPENILGYWFHLMTFIFVFALLACVTLEFIDKDKR